MTSVTMHASLQNQSRLLVRGKQRLVAFVVCLCVPVNTPLGFTLSRHADGLHYVKAVCVGSLADKTGFEAGDQILEVNGQKFEGITHSEVCCIVALLASQESTSEFFMTLPCITPSVIL